MPGGPIACVDAALKQGYFGIGVVIVYDGNAMHFHNSGGKAEEGKDATHFEGMAIRQAIEELKKLRASGGTIISDNRNAAYDVDGGKYEIRCTQELGHSPSVMSLHDHAHYHARLGLNEARQIDAEQNPRIRT